MPETGEGLISEKENHAVHAAILFEYHIRPADENCHEIGGVFCQIISYLWNFDTLLEKYSMYVVNLCNRTSSKM